MDFETKVTYSCRYCCYSSHMFLKYDYGSQTYYFKLNQVIHN